jgi:hypothetical protein
MLTRIPTFAGPAPRAVRPPAPPIDVLAVAVARQDRATSAYHHCSAMQASGEAAYHLRVALWGLHDAESDVAAARAVAAAIEREERGR